MCVLSFFFFARKIDSREDHEMMNFSKNRLLVVGIEVNKKKCLSMCNIVWRSFGSPFFNPCIKLLHRSVATPRAVFWNKYFIICRHRLLWKKIGQNKWNESNIECAEQKHIEGEWCLNFSNIIAVRHSSFGILCTPLCDHAFGSQVLLYYEVRIRALHLVPCTHSKHLVNLFWVP